MKRRRMGKMARNEALTAYAFIAPLVAGLGVFYVYSFFVNIYYSFTNKSSFGDPKWVGLKNYVKMFGNAKFYASMQNTFMYVLVCVPFVIVLSILMAALLNSKIRGTGAYRTMIFLPAVTMPAAIGLLWKWVFNFEFGILNAFLASLGLSAVAWLSDPKVVLISVSVVLIWSDVSTRMIILLAGLQGIPGVYYEAAEIDGASPLRQFFGITLPLLSPSIFFCTVMEVIGIFQIFDFIYLMIPRNSSGMAAARSLVVYFYQSAFVEFEKGYAAAITVALFVIILVVTMFQMYMQKKWVHYE